jgi:hypothetical protein
MMTKKHYIAIAAILAEAQEASWPNAPTAITAVTLDLARYFASDNPNFDPSKFFDAAGVIR